MQKDLFNATKFKIYCLFIMKIFLLSRNQFFNFLLESQGEVGCTIYLYFYMFLGDGALELQP